jgi:hypothetical protein
MLPDGELLTGSSVTIASATEPPSLHVPMKRCWGVLPRIMGLFRDIGTPVSQGGMEPLESERSSPVRPRLLAPHQST